MTPNSITLKEYLRQVGVALGGAFLKQPAQLVAQMTMELEVEQQTGAGKCERTLQRNGYRYRTWGTPAGETPLRMPKLRQGSYLPSLMKPPRRAEQALSQKHAIAIYTAS